MEEPRQMNSFKKNILEYLSKNFLTAFTGWSVIVDKLWDDVIVPFLAENQIFVDETANKIYDYLTHPEARDPEHEKARLETIRRAREEFGDPLKPHVLKINLPDDEIDDG